MRTKMAVTIREVAKEAKVSIATVSRYVNSPMLLSEETQNRVKEAIEKLDYRPNPLAVSMRTSKTNAIAFIIPDITNMYYVDLYEKIHNAAQKKGFSISLYTTDFNRKVLYKYLEEPFRYLYDGAIIAFLDESNNWEKLNQVKLDTPLVIITSDPGHVEIDNVFVDAYDAIFQATALLLNKGKERIGYIGAALNSIISQEKVRGFLDAMKNAGHNADPVYMYHGERQHFKTGVKGVEYFMSRERMPDGIVCSTDDVGIGCIKQLTKLAIPVPEQTSVIGFNGISILNSYEPELTTVAQPIQEIAASAVSLLMGSISSGSTERRRVCYKGIIKERNST